MNKDFKMPLLEVILVNGLDNIQTLLISNENKIFDEDEIFEPNK